MHFVNRIITTIISKFFINIYKKLGWGGIVLVILVIELFVVGIITNLRVFRYIEDTSAHLTVENAEIISVEEGDSETIYHLVVDVANYAENEDKFTSLGVEADGSDTLTFAFLQWTGYYSSGEERTYNGVAEKDYQESLQNEQGDNVYVLDSELVLPGRTKTKMYCDVSIDAMDGDLPEGIYFYDFSSQHPSEGYWLDLN